MIYADHGRMGLFGMLCFLQHKVGVMLKKPCGFEHMMKTTKSGGDAWRFVRKCLIQQIRETETYPVKHATFTAFYLLKIDGMMVLMCK